MDIVQSVDVWPQGTTKLPTIGFLHSQEAFVVGMKVLEFSDIDQVLWFNHAAEEFIVSGCICLKVIQSEIFSFWSIWNFTLKSQSFELVVTQFV